MMITEHTRNILIGYAEEYENAEFLIGDPSWFMHQVEGTPNQEAMALIASCLSYGNRRQFIPKIDSILQASGGEVDTWIRSGAFASTFSESDHRSFYRLNTYSDLYYLLSAYQRILLQHGTLGAFVAQNAHTGYEAIDLLCHVFNQPRPCGFIPKDAQSACKRLCMFLRWMVRSNSPVDLGLWANLIDRRSLIMPLDTHVLQQSVRLGLLKNKTASMSVARRLTDVLSEVFPDDPLRADFALFGYGVNNKGKE